MTMRIIRVSPKAKARARAVRGLKAVMALVKAAKATWALAGSVRAREAETALAAASARAKAARPGLAAARRPSGWPPKAKAAKVAAEKVEKVAKAGSEEGASRNRTKNKVARTTKQRVFERSKSVDHPSASSA